MCPIFYTYTAVATTDGAKSEQFRVPEAPFNFPPHTRVVCEVVDFHVVRNTTNGTRGQRCFVRADFGQPFSAEVRQNKEGGPSNILAVVTDASGTGLFSYGEFAGSGSKTIIASPFGRTVTISLTNLANEEFPETLSGKFHIQLRFSPLEEDENMAEDRFGSQHPKRMR